MIFTTSPKITRLASIKPFLVFSRIKDRVMVRAKYKQNNNKIIFKSLSGEVKYKSNPQLIHNITAIRKAGRKFRRRFLGIS